MPFLSMVRSACAETFSLIQRFSLATQKRRSCRLGRKRRRVLLLACETLLPVCTPLPVTWHTRDITHLERMWVAPVARGPSASRGGRTGPEAQRAGNYAMGISRIARPTIGGMTPPAPAPLQLDDPGLLRRQCPVGGAWRDADGGAACEVLNPATGEVLGTVPDMGPAETRAAIEAASAAFPAWAARTAKERADVLRRMHALMMQHQEDLARLMTAEQGKPLAESRGEIAYSAGYLEWYAGEARRMYGEVIPPHAADKRIVVLRQPMGVAAMITPWNFPSAMLGRKLAPALAAGCTVVAKPALQTPFSALALAVIAERAGLPPGVFNIVTGSDSAAIGEAMTAHPKVRKLSFTGSTKVGAQLMKQCADGIKRVSLELGGNAPFIVFEDADLDAAVQGAIDSKYRNTGQTCVCANRIFVHAAVYDAFADKLVAAVSKLRVGDGLQGETDQGPLIDAKALEKVEAHVADALEHGASVMLGGQRHALG